MPSSTVFRPAVWRIIARGVVVVCEDVQGARRVMLGCETVCGAPGGISVMQVSAAIVWALRSWRGDQRRTRPGAAA